MNFREYAKRLNLDFEVNMITALSAKEDDVHSRFLEFALFNNNKALDLTGCTVMIYANKPDGNVIFNACTNLGDNKVLVELTTQMLAAPGELECELMVITPDGAKITSKVFNINVLACINSELAIESTNEYGALSKLIKDVEDAKLNIGVAGSLLTALNDAIAGGNDVNDVLLNSIDMANLSDSTLNDTINSATGVDHVLKTTIANSETNISELESLINGANGLNYVTETELNASITTNNLLVTGPSGVISGGVGTGGDFNNVLAEGEYEVGAEGEILNKPPLLKSSYGKLIVKVSTGDIHNNKSNWIWQTLLSTHGDIYIRNKVNSGDWSEWTNLVQTDDAKNFLWRGVLLLNRDHYISLPKRITQCRNGIILVWGDFAGGQANPWNFNFTYIHKYAFQNEMNHTFAVTAVEGSDYIGVKGITVGDNYISGNDKNGQGVCAEVALRYIMEW